MKNQNILISGASIAGPALAFWLSRYGFNTTIVERAPSLRPGGYAVDFRGASMKVLERMGVIDQVRSIQTRIGAITIVDRNNKKVASMPDGFTSGELEILRGDLAEIFHHATRETTEYIFDDSITAIHQTDTGVDVEFERTPRRRFDVVIGADGLHSRVRSSTTSATTSPSSLSPTSSTSTTAASTTAPWAKKSASSAAATTPPKPAPPSSSPPTRSSTTAATPNSRNASSATTTSTTAGRSHASLIS
jgi:2-polyprenyl-6-methoxyphenol hydroxylase-like FAD-dependent oxidoreductase